MFKAKCFFFLFKHANVLHRKRKKRLNIEEIFELFQRMRLESEIIWLKIANIIKWNIHFFWNIMYISKDTHISCLNFWARIISTLSLYLYIYIHTNIYLVCIIYIYIYIYTHNM